MTSLPDLTGRIALVTGASRGIGYELARILASCGAHVIAVARTTGGLEELDDVIRSAGGDASLVPLDLKDMDGIDRLGGVIHDRWGKLDIMIANAGILGNLGPISQIKAKVFDDVIDVTTFHTDPETQFETIMPVKNRYFPAAPHPSWTAVGVNWLAGFDFEIKVIARVATAPSGR